MKKMNTQSERHPRPYGERFFNVFGAALVLTLFGASIVLAQGMMEPPMGKNPHAGMEEGRMYRQSPHSGGEGFFSLQGLKEKLSLTDDQAKKLHELFIEYRKGVIQKKASLQVAGIELEEAMSESKLDLSKIEKKAKEKEAASTDLLMYRVRSLAKAKEFLSDAQLEKFRALIGHGMMSGGRMGHMEGGPHGMMEGEGMGHEREMRGRGEMRGGESYRGYETDEP